MAKRTILENVDNTTRRPIRHLLSITDDRRAPRFKRGEVVVLEAGLAIQPGDEARVVVRGREGNFDLIGEFQSSAPGYVTVVPTGDEMSQTYKDTLVVSVTRVTARLSSRHAEDLRQMQPDRYEMLAEARS